MLVLSRHEGEEIVIGDNITVRVTEIKGDSVRLAISAPREVKVHRGEVYRAIIEANQQAAQAPVLPTELQLPVVMQKIEEK